MKNKDLINALNENNYLSVKNILICNIIELNENTINDFNFVFSNYPQIIDDQNELKLMDDKKLWTEDYLAELKYDLSNNFSKERFLHTHEVAKYLYLDINYENNPKQKSKKIEKDGFANQHPLVYVGIAVGGTLAVGFLIYKLLTNGK